MCCCGLNCCRCWFILSMIFSIIVFALLLSFQVYLDQGDGQFPVPNYASFTGFLITGNVVNFMACIGVLILLMTNTKKCYWFFILQMALVFSLCVTLYSIYFINYDTPGSRISNYTRDFYRDKKRAPYFMDYIQRNTKVTIPTPRKPEKLGCCGGLSFRDYADVTRILDPSRNNSDYIFDAPDSCCKDEFPDCGKNLTYSYHYSELGFLEEAIQLASGNYDKNLSIPENVNKIVENHKKRLKEIKKEAQAEYDQGKPSKLSLEFNIKAIPGLKNLLTDKQIENLEGLSNLVDAVDRALGMFEEFRLGRIKYVKINVIGCGRIFDSFCAPCLTVFVSIQALVNVITIIFFAIFYSRLDVVIPVTWG